MKIRAAVLGATGYTGLEVIKLLMRHPDVDLTMATSRSENGQRIDSIHRELDSICDLKLENPIAQKISEGSDVVFSCLPHAASAQFICELDSRLKIIDFSADYRLSDLAVYENVYEVTHPQPERIGKVPYGLPELFRNEIAKSNLIANPGCFPTSAILPLAPLVKDGIVQPTDIIVDSKTGVSGAGRNAKLKFHFPEMNENSLAYGVGTHRHGPEIEDLIFRYSGIESKVVFTPHLVPMTRGILSTIYVRLCKNRTIDDVRGCLEERFIRENFVRVVNGVPETRLVSGTNYCDVGIFPSGDRVVVVSAIDNLIKGASGAAIQNMNVLFGLNESIGLV